MVTASRVLYIGLLLLYAAERGVELVISVRNTRRARQRGALELGEEHYRWMVVTHAAFLPACAAEVWLFDRPFVPLLAMTSLVFLAAAMALRYWVIWTLGERWSTRVIYEPDRPRITSGPYRWLRHPNYLSVVVEMAALPLVHTAWLTAVAFSIINTGLLRTRIRVEEEALRRLSVTDTR